MEPADYKRRVAASFDRRGGSYDASVFHRKLAQRLLELAELQPGQRVLDVATGTGLAAVPAAQLVGDTGRVLGVDISAGMLGRARETAAELGLTNLTFEEADADALELGVGQFDVILCCSALVYLADILRALATWHAALTPGGVVAFTCFSDAAFLVPALLREYAADYGVRLPSPNAPCGSAERCRELVEAAGFRQVEVVTEPSTYLWQLDNPEDAWPKELGCPFTADLERLGAEDLQALRRRYVAGVEKLVPGGRLAEQVPTFFVVARK